MRRVTVMLEYFHPWTNSAGFYLARDRGFYEAAGLAVEFRVADPAWGDALQYLARGDVDFAIFPSNRLLVRRDRGEALIGIAAINHRALEMVQAIAGRGIARPRDLAGRRVALNPTPRGLAMIRHLVTSDGGDADRVTIVDSGARELNPEALRDGIADASFGSYWAWEALLPSKVPAGDRIQWPVDEIGAPPYHSYLLGTREAFAADDPELTRAFVRATREGYLVAAAEPRAALPLYEAVIPYFPQAMLAESLDLIASTWLEDGRWGVQRADKLAPYAAWLASHGILADAAIWETATTNAFLD
ncbi:ABC transporter substrate-binding protein [Sphingomonas abietis]|uniref:Thiamine pyrimidine synthase n=1 Tax=Sphingomonas abietis TaxID=3012344 RepID=A0ABY7NJQ0_9SPHN|nr:ABC transporter substrate-binding protein [Sphingomonas abietis]WBO21558.1 ABC transporter substrate-binding protein [Sphingomonas abietis]